MVELWHWRIQEGAAGGPPQQDPSLSFSHTFFLKSVRVRGRCPPPMVQHPPNGKSWIHHCLDYGFYYFTTFYVSDCDIFARHNATLNKIAGGTNCPNCHKSPTPLKPLNYKVISLHHSNPLTL